MRVTYHRNPTKANFRFGYGCVHYKEIPIAQCTKADGTIKKWVKINGERWYR